MADVTPVNGSINLGRQGENIVTRVLLPLSDIRSGDGYAVLFHQRSVDDSPYPVAVEEDGDTLIWTVTDADTAVAGRGKAEMRWIGSQGELAKSQVYKTYVAAALEIPEEVPSGYQKYVDAVAENAKDAKDAAAESRAIYGQVLNSQKKIDETYSATVAAKVKAEEAQKKAELAANSIGTAKDDAAASAETAKGAAIAAQQAAQGASVNLQGAQAAQTAAEEAAKGVAADREQIGANKSGLEAARQELTATKEQLAETKAALATTQEDLKKAQRAIQFQAALNKGQTWDFETDDQEAYKRQVPSGAKAGAVMEWGGKTVVWNQIADDWEKAEKSKLLYFPKGQTITAGHKYFIAYDAAGEPENVITQVMMYYKPADVKPVEIGKVSSTGAGKKKTIVTPTKSGISNLTDNITGSVWAYVYLPNGGGVDNIKISDLTLMFGSGNEPTDTTDPRIAQIEAYVAAHPEYNAGELLSALVDEARVANAAGDSTDTYPIPSAVRNLPGYGWSAGSVANTIERTENGWQYVQRVGSVDLGSLSWSIVKSVTYGSKYFASNSIVNPTKAPAFLTAGYTAMDSANVLATDMACWITFNWGENGRVIIRDDKYADVASFKSAMSGKPLYYELATPITTDITALMGDALAPFAVEAGGSITLHHPKADEGFAIDVPAKVQYITKLSEVSANG